MASPGWYRDNVNRGYPLAVATPPVLVRDGVGDDRVLPYAALADFVSIYQGKAADPGAIYLGSVRRAGTVLTWAVRATGDPALALEFHRDLSDLVDFQGSTAQAFVDDGCGPREAWVGVLTTGRAAALAGLVADGDVWLGSPSTTPLEPCTTQFFGQRGVWSISLANFPRIPPAPPEDCGPVPDTPEDVVVAARCLRDDVQVVAGHNVEVRRQPTLNLVRVHGRIGAGLGVSPCEVPLYDGDVDAGDAPLGGGSWCDEVVRSINGMTGAHLLLGAGPGARVGADPDRDHGVRVDLDRHDLTGGDC